MNLFLACALTVLIETPFLALFGFSNRYALTVVIASNVLTNLLLNLAFAWVLPYTLPVVLLAEAVVVAAEYLIYRAAFGWSRRLFFLTLCANALSYSAGLLLQWLSHGII